MGGGGGAAEGPHHVEVPGRGHRRGPGAPRLPFLWGGIHVIRQSLRGSPKELRSTDRENRSMISPLVVLLGERMALGSD